MVEREFCKSNFWDDEGWVWKDVNWRYTLKRAIVWRWREVSSWWKVCTQVERSDSPTTV